MVNFKKWLLSETMSVYVQGYDHQEDVHNLDNITDQIRNKLIYPLFEKLDKSQQDEIIKGGSYSHQMIAPDGDYYSNPKNQVINLYLEGWSPEVAKNLISGVKYYLDEMKVKYGPFKEDTSGLFGGRVVRIPILQFDQSASPPLFNLSNENARIIFGDLLKFPRDESSGGYSNISVADLYRKIEELEREHISIHSQDSYEVKTKGGALFSHHGMSTEDIMRRLEEIKKVAKWALENHYDQINVE